MAEPQINYAALAAEHGGNERAAPQPSAPAAGHDFKILGVNIHVPGEEKPRLDSNIVGWGEDGAGVAPEDALAVGSGIRAVARSVASGGALSGVKSAIAQASPVVKYEIAHHALRAAGIPDAAAMPLAMMVSGYKRGAAPDVAPEGPHLDRSVPVRPSDLTPQQLKERIMAGSGTAPQVRGLPKPMVGVSAQPAVEPVASGPVAPALQAGPATPPSQTPPIAASGPSPEAPSPGIPNQKALNEAALAIRRQAYQQRLAQSAAAEAPPAPVPAAAANVKLSGAETTAFLDLMKRGLSGADAMKNVLMQRELVASLGTPTPTAAQTRFPKGMRGGKGSTNP